MGSDAERQPESDHSDAGTRSANQGRQVNDDQEEGRGAGHGLLPRFVVTVLALGSFFYVLGFVVILVHTNRLKVPMIEALRFQNIVAGLPIGLVLLPAFALWRRLTREIVEHGRKSVIHSLLFAGVVLLSVPGILAEFWFLYLRSLPTNLILTVALLLPPAMSLGFFLNALTNKKFPLGIAVTRVMFIYSLLVPVIGAYALWVYPKLPQTIGGGRPERVRLYTNSRELATALGLTATPSEPFSTSCSAYLYYRTSDYLLIGRNPPDNHALIQTSLEKVQAIEWIDSTF